MNIASVIRRALFDANVVRQNGTTSGLLTQNELLSWANDCQRILEAEWRKSGKDYNLISRASDDADFTFEGETFDPSGFEHLATAVGGRTATLPPDLVTLKRIRGTTTAYREYIYTPLDINHPIFRALADTDNPSGSEIYWDVIGRRTLRFSHPLPATGQLEIFYNARLPKLRIYTDATGAANITTAVAAQVLTTGLIVADGIQLPAELILNSSGAATPPVIVSQTSTDDFVLPAGARTTGARHFPIESIDTDTGITLEAVFPLPTDTSIGYLVASAPFYLEDHYRVVIDYIVKKILIKIGSKDAQAAEARYMASLRDFQYDIHKRADEAEFVEDYVA